MKCMYCQAVLKQGKITHTINRYGYHLVIDNLPAYICPQCGESLLDEKAVGIIQKTILELDKNLSEFKKAVA